MSASDRKQGHTPGPLGFGEASGHIFCTGKDGNEGRHIATVRGTESEWNDARAEARANGAHIVACWNACERIGTSLLEAGTPLYHSEAVESLRRENEALLEVLRGLFDSRGTERMLADGTRIVRVEWIREVLRALDARGGKP